jgi:hypothetical protein
MKCPNCRGLGYVLPKLVSTDTEPYRCPICDGSKELPENIVYDRERGQAMKRKRIRRLHNLKTETEDMEITSAELALMERGFFKK